MYVPQGYFFSLLILKVKVENMMAKVEIITFKLSTRNSTQLSEITVHIAYV